MSRLRTIVLSQEPLQRADCDWAIDFAASAGSLTGMSANPPADARHRIRIARVLVRFLKLSLADQRDVAAGIGMRWTRHHAREVGVQPFPVDRLLGEAA